jgi:hypothetical protein
MTPFPPEVRRFVETTAWTFAKTYATTWPHEYLVRDERNAPMVLAIARHIFEHGVEARFYHQVRKYHHEGGKVYWSMDDTPEETELINRCDESQTYEARLAVGTLPNERTTPEGTTHAYLWPEGAGGRPARFSRRQLGDPGFDEKWLQATLFDNPDLLPLAEIDPGARRFVPVCRELALPRAGVTIYLDVFGVTAEGRPVLLECKLWRNPQARREVIAQILDYASVLRAFTYGDLQVRVKDRLGTTGANPIFDLVRKRYPDTEEARFVDGLSRSLKAGDFLLVVAGDGIHTDLDPVAKMLDGTVARLGLVEVRLWSDEEGRLLVVPSLALRTEVLRQRVLIDRDGQPLTVEDDEEVAAPAPQTEERRSVRAANRAFFQRFIDEVVFDHAEQEKPVHGGENWVRAKLPKPVDRMVIWRSPAYDSIGVSAVFPASDDSRGFIESLRRKAAELKKDSGLDLRLEDTAESVSATVEKPYHDAGDDEEQLVYLKKTANAMVNLLRPRLNQWANS